MCTASARAQEANPLGRNNALRGKWRAPVIPRGDLGSTWTFLGFEEIRRLNCQPETEELMRKAGEWSGARGVGGRGVGSQVG